MNRRLSPTRMSPREARRTEEAYPMDVFLCRDCAHVQLLDVVDPTSLQQLPAILRRFRWVSSSIFKRYARPFLTGSSRAPGSLVMDIGSNEGVCCSSFSRSRMKGSGWMPPKHRRARQPGGRRDHSRLFHHRPGRGKLNANEAARPSSPPQCFRARRQSADMLDRHPRIARAGGVFVFGSRISGGHGREVDVLTPFITSISVSIR